MQELLWYNYFPVCDSSAPWLCGGANAPPTPEGLLPHALPPRPWNQSPCPYGRPLLTPASAGDTQTLQGRSGSIFGDHCSFLWVLVCTMALFAPSEHLWWVWGLILNMDSPLLLSSWGFPFALARGYVLFGGGEGCYNIVLSMVVQQLVAILVFLQEKISACPCNPYLGITYIYFSQLKMVEVWDQCSNMLGSGEPLLSCRLLTGWKQIKKQALLWLLQKH